MPSKWKLSTVNMGSNGDIDRIMNVGTRWKNRPFKSSSFGRSRAAVL